MGTNRCRWHWDIDNWYLRRIVWTCVTAIKRGYLGNECIRVVLHLHEQRIQQIRWLCFWTEIFIHAALSTQVHKPISATYRRDHEMHHFQFSSLDSEDTQFFSAPLKRGIFQLLWVMADFERVLLNWEYILDLVRIRFVTHLTFTVN